jgi:hypothetical protein
MFCQIDDKKEEGKLCQKRKEKSISEEENKYFLLFLDFLYFFWK